MEPKTPTFSDSELKKTRSKSFQRKATTEGAAGPVRIESPRADELSELDLEAIKERDRIKMAQVRAHRAAGGGPGFVKGNKLGGKRPKLAKLGIKKIDVNDPDYRNCLKQAESYRRMRVREYTQNFGRVSIGVRGLLATASLQIAASRYMMDKAMGLGDMDMLKKASTIANDARQNELAAWELCSREAVVQKKNEEAEMPWMVRVGTEQAAASKKSHEAIDGSDADENPLGVGGDTALKKRMTNEHDTEA